MNDHMTFLEEQGTWLGGKIRVDFINELERLITYGERNPGVKFIEGLIKSGMARDEILN